MEPKATLVRTVGDRYRLLEEIGDGGMGRVFRAQELATGQIVALKLLHPELSSIDEVVRRFEREAQVTTRLSHPHIVKVVEFGESNGSLFIAMEFLAGRSLASLIAEGSPSSGTTSRRGLTVERTIAIMRPVLSALEYAHSAGVVHRDLKPENIMVAPARGRFRREQIKLLDFGVAKLVDHAESAKPKLTQLGLTVGTPSYMSPEQTVGQKADARSDIYSCGVILYEMLTGRRPFEADSTLEVLSMQLNATPRPLREVAAEARIPVALENVVLRALAKQPGDRFQSAGELRRALERAAVSRDEGTEISGLEKTSLALPAPTRRRSRWMLLPIAALAAAILIGDHWRPRTPNVGRSAVASDVSDAARRAREPAARTSSQQAGSGAAKRKQASRKPAVRNR